MLHPQQAIDFVTDSGFGAMSLFLGRIRDNNLGKHVVGVSYDVFDSLACCLLKTLIDEAHKNAEQPLKCYIEHFKGYLDVGGVSVLVAVGSTHRQEAFETCQFLIEELKHRVPIWKKEHYINGETGWVQGHSLCAHTQSLKKYKTCQ
ncbi:MAG: molybdenum cofactor biosynthesis protein MoaE [Alphaproteobacteria bacterium]